MEDNPAPNARRLMDITTFKENFGDKWVNQTYLCYEMEVWEGNAWAPVEKLQDFLRNQGADTPWEPRRHAELCFLDRFPSWALDQGKEYRFTWYISWSPCPDCVPELVAFLAENSHVSLRIFAARIYTKIRGYERGLRDLRDAGAQITIMTLEELQHCWGTFVENQGQPLEPWPELEVNIETQCQNLKAILWPESEN